MYVVNTPREEAKGLLNLNPIPKDSQQFPAMEHILIRIGVCEQLLLSIFNWSQPIF